MNNYEIELNKINSKIKYFETEICHSSKRTKYKIANKLNELKSLKKNLETEICYQQFPIELSISESSQTIMDLIDKEFGIYDLKGQNNFAEFEKIKKPEKITKGSLSKVKQAKYKPKKKVNSGKFSPNGDNHNNGYLDRRNLETVCINGNCINTSNPKLEIKVVSFVAPKLVEYSPIYGMRSL